MWIKAGINAGVQHYIGVPIRDTQFVSDEAQLNRLSDDYYVVEFKHSLMMPLHHAHFEPGFPCMAARIDAPTSGTRELLETKLDETGSGFYPRA